MFNKRIIPTLLLSKNKLVKTEKFKSPIYVGDPINVCKIFNEMEVDELSIIDIGCTRYGYEPNFELIEKIASECFMPISYGGGIKTAIQASKILRSGVEKIILQSSVLKNPKILEEISEMFGSQSITVSLDFTKRNSSYKLFRRGFFKNYYNIDVKKLLNDIIPRGVGELLINYVDHEGTLKGLDFELLDSIKKIVDIPIIFSGGANSLENMREAFINGAYAIGVGRMFTFHGPHKAVLISYINRDEIKKITIL